MQACQSFPYCISFICFIGAGSREQALEVIDNFNVLQPRGQAPNRFFIGTA
jgi:hypothetical protein